jgi:nitric oxide reductase NorD protein
MRTGAMRRHVLATRRRGLLPAREAEIEIAVAACLAGAEADAPRAPAARRHMIFAPVPFWLSLTPLAKAGEHPDHSEDAAPAPAATIPRRKMAARKDRGEATRRDSFIIHRFEATLSWVKSMILNCMIDDDDEENAAKAADHQVEIVLPRHDRKAATKLRMHLDLSPADAEHERLSGVFTYREWDRRTGAYLPDHCRVLEGDAPATAHVLTLDPRAQARVRAQPKALRPRRILRPRQIEGEELDRDALIAARVEMAATGRGGDRIHQASRTMDRDLAVGALMDTSRSTEAAISDGTVIDVAREALAALAGGIDAAGDRLGGLGVFIPAPRPGGPDPLQDLRRTDVPDHGRAHPRPFAGARRPPRRRDPPCVDAIGERTRGAEAAAGADRRQAQLSYPL